jgi:hypothetical protein
MPEELPLEKRIQVLVRIDEGVPYRRIMDEFSIAKGTISRIKQARHALMESAARNAISIGMRYSRLKGSAAVLDKRVYEWFCAARGRGLPVTGPLLKEKARITAEILGIAGFKASNGWLESFQRRHAVKWRTISGEGMSTPIDASRNWSANVMDVLAEYELADIYNCDETGLFWRALPNRTLAKRGECCKGGKLSKERLTVLFTVSASGEKAMPVVIGKAKMPRSFGKRLPPGIKWFFNKKAWMTTGIFTDYLEHFNACMAAQGRMVALILDNAPCHPRVQMSNIRLFFLPPNTTAETQPLDAGIIRSMKVRYRARLLAFLFGEQSGDALSHDFVTSITVAQAVSWISCAWAEVEGSTITECFQHCGIGAVRSENAADVFRSDESDVIRLGESVGLSDIEFYEVVPAYEVAGDEWEAKILCPDSSGEEDDEGGHESQVFYVQPSWREAVAGWNAFKTWHLASDEADLDDLVGKLDERIGRLILSKVNQSSILEFFRPHQRQ